MTISKVKAERNNAETLMRDGDENREYRNQKLWQERFRY